MNTNEIIEIINNRAKMPGSFITAKFGDRWKENAKKNYDFDSVIDLAWFQGRRAMLLERELELSESGHSVTVNQLIRTQQERNRWRGMCEKMLKEMDAAEWVSLLQEEARNMLNSDKNLEGSDTTESPSTTDAGNQNTSQKEGKEEDVEALAEAHSKINYAKAAYQEQKDADYIQSVSKHSFIAGYKAGIKQNIK